MPSFLVFILALMVGASYAAKSASLSLLRNDTHNASPTSFSKPGDSTEHVRHDGDLLEEALRIALHESANDFQHRDLANLMRASKDIRDLVSEIPEWKYLMSVVKNKRCLDRLFMQNASRSTSFGRPTVEKPIRYLYLDKDFFALSPQVICLDRLVASKIPIEIVTCSHETFKNHPLCASFTLKMIRNNLFGYGETYVGYNNVSWARRVLLSTSIDLKMHDITDFLLTPSNNPNKTTPIAKQHLWGAMTHGDEGLFVRLHELAKKQGTLSPEMLVYDGIDLFEHALNNFDPSLSLLKILCSLAGLTQNHFVKAVKLDRKGAFDYLITESKLRLDESTRHHYLQNALATAALYAKTDFTRILLNETGNELDSISRDLVLRNALQSRDLSTVKFFFNEFGVEQFSEYFLRFTIQYSSPEILEYVLKQAGIRINAALVLDAIRHLRSLQNVFWLIDQLQMKDLLKVFANADFSNYSDPLKDCRNMIIDAIRKRLAVLGSQNGIKRKRVHRKISV